MAKMKLNLKGDWKSLLLTHGEKIGLAVVGVVVLLLLWSALGQEGLSDSQQPDDLIALASSAKQHITEATWADYPEKPELPPIDSQATFTPLKVQPYETVATLNPPIWTRKNKRTDPKLLPPIQLEAHSGYGAFALVDPNAMQYGGMPGAPGAMPGAPVGPGASGQPGALINPNEGALINPNQGGLFGPGGGGLLAPGGEGMLGGGGMLGLPGQRPLPQWVPIEGVQPGMGSKLEGRHWIVVNALVPKAKQIEAFDLAFAEAEGYKPAADMPEYIAYQVQRTEIVPGEEPQWETIAGVTAKQIAQDTRQWSTQAGGMGGPSMGGPALGGPGTMMPGMPGGANAPREIVDPRYLHPVLTFPLGPLVMENWDEEVTHTQVPLAPTPEELRQQMLNRRPLQQEPEATPQAQGEETPGFFEQLNQRRGNPNGPGMGQYPGGPGMGQYPGGPGYGEGGYGPGMGGYGMNPELRRPVPYYLLRYFDFDAEPGKSYQYRIRLVMRDPNYHRPAVSGMGGDPMMARRATVMASPGMASPGGEMGGPASNLERVPEKYLDPSVVERLNATKETLRPFRVTDWSESSPVCQCELGETMLAGEVKAPTRGRFYDVPSAVVLVEEFDFETGLKTSVEQKFSRGDTGHLKADIEVIDPVLKQLVKKKEQTFAVDATVLDIRGGGRLLDPRAEQANAGRPRYLSSELTAPGAMLFLDANGDLRVRRELADREKVIFHREWAKEPEIPKPTESGPGGEMLGPGMGPGYEETRPGRRPRGSRGP